MGERGSIPTRYVEKVGSVLSEEYSIYGNFDLPTIVLRPDEFSLSIWERLQLSGVDVADVRILGSVAAFLVSDTENSHSTQCNDLDLVFMVDFDYHSAIVKFDIILRCVMECLRDLFPAEFRSEGENLPTGALSSAYVNKMVKVPNLKAQANGNSESNGTEDCWSLISLRNKSGINMELKFVQNLRRHCEFSMDSVQVILSKDVLKASARREAQEAWPEHTTVEAVSVYGDIKEAIDHINRRIIAIKYPEQLRGGGLLKYCRLLSEGYTHPANMSDKEIQKLQRSMCTRFFIDFPTIDTQHNHIVSYIHSHFPDPRVGLSYLNHMKKVIVNYTLENPYERASTIEVLDVLMQHTAEFINHVDSMTNDGNDEDDIEPPCVAAVGSGRNSSLGDTAIASKSFARIVASPAAPTPPRSPLLRDQKKKKKKTKSQSEGVLTEEDSESSVTSAASDTSDDVSTENEHVIVLESSTTVLLYPSPPDTPEMSAMPIITLNSPPEEKVKSGERATAKVEVEIKIPKIQAWESPKRDSRGCDQLTCKSHCECNAKNGKKKIVNAASSCSDQYTSMSQSANASKNTETSEETKEEIFASCRASMVATDNLVLLRGLLNRGIVNVNDRGYLGNDKSEGQTLLMVASKYGRHKCMKELVDKFGADINLAGGVGAYTALHYAAFHGHLNAVLVLLERGAKTDMKTMDGETPAQAATAGGKKEIARLLNAYSNNGQVRAADHCVDEWQQCSRKSKMRRKGNGGGSCGGNLPPSNRFNQGKGHNNVRKDRKTRK
eukprot:CFRG5492T1